MRGPIASSGSDLARTMPQRGHCRNLRMAAACEIHCAAFRLCAMHISWSPRAGFRRASRAATPRKANAAWRVRKRMDDVRERFQNLHEFLKVAKFKLNRNNWDYVVGGTETETTLARNRQSLDSIAFKPRVLRNVQNVDCSTELFGRKIRMPVLIAPVGGLQLFWDGGVPTVAEAAGEFGIPMMQSSATEPPIEVVAKKAPDAF